MHRKTGKLFALKNLERERFPTHLFLRELRFLLTLQHPNIVTCHALEHTNTGRYLVMDYCEGGTLRSLMVDDVGLPLHLGIQLIVDVLNGLDSAHQQKIVHCDIKPENVLLTLTRKGWAAKISDFGIARLNQETYDKIGGNTGSPAYMAPERFYNQYSVVSDLYAVGIMFFELLVGHRPFIGTPKALMAAHLNQPVQFPETLELDIPAALKEVINISLQKLPARRFQSAKEMLNSIRVAVEGTAVSPWQHARTLEMPLVILRQTVPCYASSPQQQIPLPQPATLLAGWRLPQITSASPPVGKSSSEAEVIACHTCYANQTLLKNQIYYDGLAAKQSSSNSQPPQFERSLTLSEPIQQLLVAPQGYFLITRRTVFWIDSLPVSDPSINHLSAQPIYQLTQDCVATIEPEGHWLALVTDYRNDENSLSAQEGSTLSFHPLPRCPIPIALPQSSIRLRAASKAQTLLQAIALDKRHIIVLSDGPRRKPQSSGEQPKGTISSSTALQAGALSMERATYLEVFTRRGTRLGIQRLPMLLGNVITTPTPYRLLATDQYDPTSILCIDLKPFRIQRFALDIIPAFLMAAPWGYIVANTEGKVMFLDSTGYAVSTLETPFPITAATFVSPHFLLTTTWQGGEGALYIFNLKQQPIDWVF